MYKKWWLGYLLQQNCHSQLILSRLHPRIHCIWLDERYIPIFVYRYGCSDDLNKMTNLHCCHCLGGGGQVVLSSWLSIKLWQFNIQCLTKTQIKYFKHFIKTFGESRFFGDCRPHPSCSEQTNSRWTGQTKLKWEIHTLCISHLKFWRYIL